MSETIEQSYVWDHTISKILHHDLQSDMGNMIKEWVILNKLEDFTTLMMIPHQLVIFVFPMTMAKSCQL